MKVNLSGLSRRQKKEVWAWIKEERPWLAEYLKSDHFKMMRDELGCELLIALEKI